MYSYYEEELRDEKSKIRKSKRRARASFSGQARAEADEALYNSFISSGFVEKYDSFFVYNSVNTEADTRRLIKTLLEKGKAVYLPRVLGKELEAVPYCDKFVKSPFGVEEPMGDAYRGHIAAAIVPAFAFDLHGFRVGYGGGYYDRFLADRPIFKIGYCYDFQIISNAPAEMHDIPVDYILTDKRSRPCIGSSSPFGQEDERQAIKEPSEKAYELCQEQKNKEENKDETEDN